MIDPLLYEALCEVDRLTPGSPPVAPAREPATRALEQLVTFIRPPPVPRWWHPFVSDYDPVTWTYRCSDGARRPRDLFEALPTYVDMRALEQILARPGV